MKNERTIEVLNTLITINNDRIEGYQTAAEETDEQDLKDLFARFTQTSRKCKQELIAEVKALGGEAAEGTLTSGKFFRVWMDLKSALTGRNRKVILDSCEYGEDIALDTYATALRDDLYDISSEQQSMINAQHNLIEADHDMVKALRDNLVRV